MLELLKYIAQSLVDKPDDVRVTQSENEKTIILGLSVAPDDMGKVIGKQGRIAMAIRTVIKAASSRSKKKYVVEIVEHD
jgi:predicted RNA-binding protein YlqC (UPF0109 family)